MSSSSLSISDHRWYAVQTLSNMEGKAKAYLDKFIEIEEMGEYVAEVLMPSEKVTEVKNGRKSTRTRKFYPGYVFVKVRLYDEAGKILQKPWYFIQDTQGVIGFVGGENPVPLKKAEIDRILNQVKDSEGRDVPKIAFEVGETVKITDGPFLNLSGQIDEIDVDRGRLSVSVSIFGRQTPVDLEFWQVDKIED